MHNNDSLEYGDNVVFRVTLPSRLRLLLNLGLIAIYCLVAMIIHLNA
ncbi:hypothetical protein ACWKW9_18495 [Rhizobium daejeonense]